MSAHVLVLNRWPQYADSAQWDNELSRYDELIPRDHAVSYLCDPAGATGVPRDVAPHRIATIENFGDPAVVAGAVTQIVERHGAITHVVALSEYLLDTAATIRQQFGIAGHRPADVDRYRDKTVMKRLLHDANLRAPRWVTCTADRVATERQALELGFPLILKPVRGASSKGVETIDSIDGLRKIIETRDLAGYEIEEFIDGDIYHVDGVLDQAGHCVFACVSRYISSCLKFEAGAPLGSIVQTPSATSRAYKAFALDCLKALGLTGSAFHLELFDRNGELVFLEVGARVPGADVPYVVHQVFGVNLFQLWMDVVLAHPRSGSPARATVENERSGGWITIPRPRPLPCKVISATSLLGRVPGLYREFIPSSNQILAETGGGYTNLQGGRFLIQADTEDMVLAAMNAIRTRYELRTIPV
jgi:hypothetical protein